MELFKYYSLDETFENRDKVIDKLEKLEEKDKIYFEIREEDDILIIEDLELNDYEIKKLVEFLHENNVIKSNIEEDDDNGYIDDDFLPDDY